MTQGFGIILPTYSAAAELRLCIQSLRRNSRLEHNVMVLADPYQDGKPHRDVITVLEETGCPYKLNERRLGPYGSWNLASGIVKDDVLCFITDDQYFAPSWDEPLLRHLDEYPVLTSVLVEPGIIRPYQTNLMHDFGHSAAQFDEQGFLQFVARNLEDRVARDGFYIPTVIHRRLFERLGGWPDKRPFPHPNDFLFRKALHSLGLEYHRVLTSFSYHFQRSSVDPHSPRMLYFDRPDHTRPTPPFVRQLLSNAKLRAAELYCTVHKSASRARVSGYRWPKKADARLIYKYCIGRGVEIGAGAWRIPNINTRTVDLSRELRNGNSSIAPPPDIVSTAYDLSMLPNESFDFVINSHLMEHLIDPLGALLEWKRFLKPSGILLMIVPDKRYKPVDRDYPETTIDELSERHQQSLRETLDDNPKSSCLGDRRNAKFAPSGEPGWRHFNYWTPDTFLPLIHLAGLEVVEVLEAQSKNQGLDLQRWNYDDFTVVARKSSIFAQP